MNCPCSTAKSQPKQPTLLESAGETVLLLLIVAVIAVVPLLVCEWLACVALPVPANGTPEMRQAVAAQREALAKMLFGLLWAVIGGLSQSTFTGTQRLCPKCMVELPSTCDVAQAEMARLAGLPDVHLFK